MLTHSEAINRFISTKLRLKHISMRKILDISVKIFCIIIIRNDLLFSIEYKENLSFLKINNKKRLQF